MDLSLLTNGALLMLVGMGTVFFFLGLMVLCINALAKVVEPFSHLLPEPPAKAPAPKRPIPAATGDDELLAVLTAAVHRYRAEHFTK